MCAVLVSLDELMALEWVLLANNERVNVLRCCIRCLEGEEGHHVVSRLVVHSDGFHDELSPGCCSSRFCRGSVKLSHEHIESFPWVGAAVRFWDWQTERFDIVDEFVLLVELFDHIFPELDGFKLAALFFRLLFC